MFDEASVGSASNALNAWYLEHARDLPWRQKPDLYGTWLSEIMLQQTRVETGIPKWFAFRDRFPEVTDLAQASEDDVLKAWEGLGYYRRARLLHRAAKAIHEAGEFPSTHAEWLALPGVGPYTAAAIASIGLGEAVAAVDGNVQRVIARWLGMTHPVDSKDGIQHVQATADAWLNGTESSRANPGNHNQAVMELGALVCSPRQPQCNVCPLAATCASAQDESMWSRLPVKLPKKKPTSWKLNWHVVKWGNQVAVVQRPEDGVWAKLWAFPEHAPPDEFASLGKLFDPVIHVLSHRKITATMWGWEAPDQEGLERFAQSQGGTAVEWRLLEELARPRLMTKMWDQLSLFVGEAKL
ncbi:MAG: A/G-specific adenine glycosylase [Flavobacteriales bacterium]